MVILNLNKHASQFTVPQEQFLVPKVFKELIGDMETKGSR